MTIDEAIAKEKYRSDRMIEHSQLHCVTQEFFSDIEYHKQLAEWLELLKWYQQGMEDIPSESGVLPRDVYRAGYNKAIDDFAEALKKYYQCYDIDLCLQDNDHFSYTDSFLALESYIDDIAQQLKAGGENDMERL